MGFFFGVVEVASRIEDNLHSLNMLKNLTVAALSLLVGVGIAHAKEEKAVRIGFQKSGAFLLVKSEGTLDEAFKKIGYKVEWKEFPAGPPLIEALNAGSLDIGHSGDGPLIFAQANGVPFVYLANTNASPKSSAIIVPKDSPLKQAADLKGKKVAFARGSSSHYLVAKALEKEGLSFADITPIFLSPPDARAAFQSGTIDAWGIWDPFYAAAEIDSQARVLAPGEGLTPHREFYFARKDFITENPQIVDPLLDVLNASGEKAVSDPKATAAFLADKLGISLSVLERSEGRKLRYGGLRLTDEIVAEQQGVADLFLSQGLLKAPIKVSEALYQPAP